MQIRGGCKKEADAKKEAVAFSIEDFSFRNTIILPMHNQSSFRFVHAMSEDHGIEFVAFNTIMKAVSYANQLPTAKNDFESKGWQKLATANDSQGSGGWSQIQQQSMSALLSGLLMHD